MSRVSELVQQLGHEWAEPREAIHRGERSPFLLACTFDPLSAGGADVESLSVPLANGIRDFWAVAQRADLFKDQQYGQWGIEILSPIDAAAETRRQLRERPHDFQPSDLVVGRFFGDSDLIVLRCDNSGSDFGSVRIALPLDPRADWPQVAESFDEFLERLMTAQGDKYWETVSR